jgi:hypothetical protein
MSRLLAFSPTTLVKKIQKSVPKKTTVSKKQKTDLFPREFVPELNTKNLENSPSFLTITHTTLSTKQFRSYRILTIDVPAEFCSGQNSSGMDLQFSVSDWLKF